MFFKNILYFRVFKFSTFIANNAIDFLSFETFFRIYWKYFNIVLSFFLYFFGENKLLYTNKLLTFNKQSINPIQWYPYIIESYAFIL